MALQPCPHCGHPISEKAEKCPACGQNPRLTPKELAMRKDAKRAKQKRALSIAIPSTVLIAAALLFALLLLPDYQRYQTAKKQMDAGEYLSAIENFDALGDYLTGADLSLQCKAQVINPCTVPDAATASRFSASLVAGGYRSAPGAAPGTTVWYRGNDPAAAQLQQRESKFCIINGCMQERMDDSFACRSHACKSEGCKNVAVAGKRYCPDHMSLLCHYLGCENMAVSFGGYCNLHQR